MSTSKPTAMDQANGSDAAGQSKRLEQVQPQTTTSNASDHESGRSDHDLAQPQPTPPKQTRPAIQRKESHHHPQQAQQRSQKHQDKNASSSSASHLRQKTQKHVVGGGMSTTRLHARVPSSKALHKASSAKTQHQQQQQLQQLQQLQELKELQQFQQLQQQQLSYHRSRASGTSGSPPHPADSGSQQQQRPQLHRRSTSGNESKLMRSGNSSSATSLVRRNVSATNLKRNKSHADVSRRTGHTRPVSHLKRTATSDRHKGLPSPNKKQAGVHFEIGSPDAQEDEWVDAGSSNVSGSRKNSLQYKDSHRDESVAQAKDETEEDEEEEEEEEQREEQREEEEEDEEKEEEDGKEQQIVLQPPPKPKEHMRPIGSATDDGSQSQPPNLRPVEQKQETEALRPSSSASSSGGLPRTSSTSRLLLPRTPPAAAPPMMSTETVSVTHNMQSSPDVSPSQVAQVAHLPSGSSDRDVMTSRFITTGSHESTSNATAGDSFYTTSSSRPGTARNDPTTPKSTDGSSVPSTTATPLRACRGRAIGGDTPLLTDEDDSGIAASADGRSSATAATAATAATTGGSHPRRTRAAHAPPAELSRTQQKLNLERASSSIDRSSRQHQGPAAGPLLGAGESGMHDPRIGKLMERAGMEYYVVRRYQNPVTRSLARLSSRIEADKNVRVPANASPRSSPGMAVNANLQAPGRSSSGGSAGLSQSFRERDMRRDALQSATAAAGNGTMPPLTRSRTFTANGPSGSSGLNGNNAGGPGSTFQPQQQRLSGSSLVDSYDEDSTAALLRNLWNKNLYLGTSQD